MLLQKSRSAFCTGPRAPRRCIAVRASATATKSAPVKELLNEMKALGAMRFIVLGEGAILESVSSFSAARYTDIPNKGTLATIANADKTFECHLYLAKLKTAKFAKTKAKHGDHIMYATRFVDGEGKVLVSCLLASQGEAGVYDAGAVAAWDALHAKYGDEVALC